MGGILQGKGDFVVMGAILLGWKGSRVLGGGLYMREKEISKKEGTVC